MNLPYVTTVTAAKAAIQAIESIQKGEVVIRSMDGYHRDPVHELQLEDFREERG